MQGVCMAVIVLMVGTDNETPHILCRLVTSSTRVLLVEDQLSDKYRRDHVFGGGGNPDAISIFQLPGEYS
jgi:hypothetical protein